MPQSAFRCRVVEQPADCPIFCPVFDFRLRITDLSLVIFNNLFLHSDVCPVRHTAVSINQSGFQPYSHILLGLSTLLLSQIPCFSGGSRATHHRIILPGGLCGD